MADNSLLTLFFIVGVILIIVSILYLDHPQDNTNNSPPNPIAKTPEEQVVAMTPVPGWGPQTPVTGPQGVCLVYTFGSTITGATDRTIAYGNPNVEFSNLIFNSDGIPSGSTPANPITASKTEGKCVYPDQLAAKLVQHTCESQSSQGYRCVKRNGVIASVGEVEKYFTPCTLPACTNVLSFVSLGFNVEPNTAVQCIAQNRDPGVIDVELLPCRYDPKFLFDITRADAGTFTVNPSGVLAKVQNRETGKCLNAAGFGVGAPIIMTDCTINNGFTWSIIPPTEFTIDGKTFTSVQQLCYNTNGVYPSKEDILANKVRCMSLEFFGRPAIVPFQISSSTLSQTQFLDYTLYNSLANISVPNYPLLLNFPTSL
jgi:hypothetical protein